MDKNQWKDAVTLVAGAGLAGSPWVLGHADAASRMLYNAVATGLAFAILSIADLLMTKERPTAPSVKAVGGSFAAGLWAIASPWVLGFSNERDMTFCAVAIGVVVAVVSLWQVVERYDVSDRLIQ